MSDIGKYIQEIFQGGVIQFHTLEFWTIFLIFIPIYALLKHRRWQMMTFVIMFSLYFYWRASGRFVLLLGATALADYAFSHLIEMCVKPWKRRLLLICSLCCTIGVLGYFKYADFFMWNWNLMVQGNFTPSEILLPVGISFYTFQSISYVVDVYRKDMPSARSFWDYLFFLSYFPAILAGPIMRARTFLTQLYENVQPAREVIYSGLWLIIIGVVKKVIFADYLGEYNDMVFAMPDNVSSFGALMGVVGYTMQIYLDFSGYSDMAIGISLILGFNIGINFNYPYKARNISDFWHRWHISLSTWLKDYIYIPLGGNRRRKARVYLNNLVTMLIAGLWHGTAWRFVIWGGMHGLGLVVHKSFKSVFNRIPDTFPVKAISWFITIGYISLLWIFFRADSWQDGLSLLETVFSPYHRGEILTFVATHWLWLALLITSIVFQSLPAKISGSANLQFVRAPWVIKLSVLIAVIFLIDLMGSHHVTPFIYNNF